LRAQEVPVLVAVLLVGLSLGALLESRDRERYENVQREDAAQVGIETLQQVTDRVSRMALGLSRLTATAEVLPELDAATFESIAQSIVYDVDLRGTRFDAGTSSILSIAYAPDEIVRFAYPVARNRNLIGLDYRNVPDQYEDVARTRAAFGPVLSHPFEALQGGTAIAIREALRDSRGNPTGLVSIAIDLEAFLSTLRQDVLEDHGYLLQFGVRNSPFAEDLGLRDQESVNLDIRTYGLDWTLDVVPVGGWAQLPLLTPARVGVPLATLFLLLSVHLRYLRHRQSRQVVERLEKGLDALSAAFVIYDKDDRLLHWNETYPALLGYGDMVKKGMTHEDILREGLARGHFRVPAGQEEAWVQENLERHRQSDYAVEFELSNGKWIRAMSRKTADGDRVGVRFDVTDLKRAQIASERSSAAKSEFIALVSHELRTPLTVILGFGKLLKNGFRAVDKADKTEPDAFAANAVDRIVVAGEGLLVLVNNMLDYIHLKTGTLGKNPREFVLNEAMSSAMSRVAASAAEKSISLEMEENADRIIADPVRVEQVLDQLLSNAVKFTEPGGTVSLRSAVEPESVKIAVEDNGPGIPDDKLDVIFDEFSQLQPTGTRREGGTGLGLAIARQLAKFQGGDVLVESVLGQGSVFTFVLPR
jgi:signal transduction histidine kinase